MNDDGPDKGRDEKPKHVSGTVGQALRRVSDAATDAAKIHEVEAQSFRDAAEALDEAGERAETMETVVRARSAEMARLRAGHAELSDEVGKLGADLDNANQTIKELEKQKHPA